MTKFVYINNGSNCRIRRTAEDINLITKIIIASKPLYSREAFKSPVTNSISNNDIMGKAIVAYSISYVYAGHSDRSITQYCRAFFGSGSRFQV